MNHSRPQRRLVRLGWGLALATITGLLGCATPHRAEPSASAGFAAAFQHGCVAADHPDASEAGAEVLRLGGNAVDAAVATSFALSVVRPESCGIGGGGFMLIHLDRHPRFEGLLPIDTAIDYRERAPAAATRDMFEKSNIVMASEQSGLAVAIPGTVAGLLTALEKYGTLDRAAVLAPAIRLARDGWIADKTTVKGIREGVVWNVKPTEGATGGEGPPVPEPDLTPGILLRARLYEGVRAGDVIRNEGQARALELIAERGRDGFYRGEVAEAICRSTALALGVLTLDDLGRFESKEVPPLRGTFMGRAIVAMPLPSSGGVTMLETLGMLAEFGVAGWHNVKGEVDRLHVLAEAFRLAFFDRARWLGDPEFGHDPSDDLMRPERIRYAASLISPDHVFPINRLSLPLRGGFSSAAAVQSDWLHPQEVENVLPDDHGTSHLSVVDRWGNAVACTFTINTEYGSKVGVPEFGFFLNNEMDDFLTRRGQANTFGLTQSERNLPEPGKRPLSSMSPTIVLDQAGKVEMVVGASGGPRIITGVTQVLLNVIVSGMHAGEAVAAPRIHHQWMPDTLRVEFDSTAPPTAPGVSDHTIVKLIQKGHHVVPLKDSSSVQVIVRRGDMWEAACDPRKGGRPAGEP